jgi:glycosyltransferase involved in cell wall biosynthesis
MKQTEQKTVAIVINTSWNIFNFRLGLLRALQAEGYRIVCIAPRDKYSQKLQTLGFEYREIRINNKGTNPIEDIKLIGDFYRLYKTLRPHLLLHYTIKPNIYGTMAAALLDIPVISNISGLGTVFLNERLSSRIARVLYRFALRFPKKVFFQNPHDRELFIETKLVRERLTDLLPGSGVDTGTYRPQAVEKEAGAPFVFLLIARMVKDKGIIEFVEAAEALAASHAHAEFWLLGSFYPGNPTAITEEEMTRWSDQGIVKYLGHSDDVPSVVAQADCIVLPSYREGLSRVLLEAASMAKPIITTDVPGCKDVVYDGVSGYLCRAKCSKSLKEQMLKMLKLTPARRIRMGRHGREKIVREFDESIVIEKYIDAIDGLLHPQSPQRSGSRTL